MTAPSILTNDLPDASLEASGPSFGVSFFVEGALIKRVTLFSHPTFCCQVFGASSLGIFDYIKAYLAHEPLPSLPLDWSGLSPFTLKGLKAILSIPFGETASYKEVAERAGDLNAARAIGGVCNRNPFALVVPCHRVVAARSIGGFGYDLNLKKTLLQFETETCPYS